MPSFSIIIPVYNVAQYIRKCLNSVLSQDFSDWETLLIDDGSTDGSGVICDEYGNRDSRFRVFHKPNGGVSSARNMGLDHARGEWIWFVDSDDYIIKDALSILDRTIKNYDCDTVFFEISEDRDGIASERSSIHNTIDSLEKNEFLCKVYSYLNQAILFKATYFQQHTIRFSPDIRMAEDLEVQYKYLIFALKPIKIYDRLYIYRKREGSATDNPDTDRNNMKDCIQVCNHLLDYIKSNHIAHEQWLSMRVRRLLKSCIQSAERVPKTELKDLQIQLRQVIDGYYAYGYTRVADKTLKLALINLNLYFICLRLYYKLKGK